MTTRTGPPIGSILIVGGGTAGWMSAVVLQKVFGPEVSLTLVESATVPTVGVGEASVSSIKAFFEFCGLPEAEWMPACNATYKLAIKFVDWNAARSSFFHPFERAPEVDGRALPEWWLSRGRDEFDRACFITPALCDAARSPLSWDGRLFDQFTRYPYAYHFDASLLARYLAGVAAARGVGHTYGDVTHVALGGHEEISGVHLDDGRILTADFYLDCTGFRGLLINQALREPFRSFSDALLCDRAVATQWPSAIGAEIRPFTTATATTAGWIWDIPLYNRVGAGYVYCSALASAADAEAELASYLGGVEADVRHLAMRVGVTNRPWVGNCLSVGLSAGFVEPLESTGIFLIQFGVGQFAAHLEGRRYDEETIGRYNRTMVEWIEAVRDFLILHFWASDRRDTPFWRAVKDDVTLPDALADRLATWRLELPRADSVDLRVNPFVVNSYQCMLLGLHYLCPPADATNRGEESDPVGQAFAEVATRARQLAATLPSHRSYLAHLRGEQPD